MVRMKRPIEIPEKDYNFLCNFFKEDQETWDKIKYDVNMLRYCAKQLIALGWYDPEDKNEYEYFLEIKNGAINIERKTK